MRVSTDEFLERLSANPPIRVPGTAIVLASSPKGVPRSLLHHLKHNRVLHERLIIVSVIVTDEPHVADAEHLKLVPVGEGIARLIVHIGFMDKPNVPAAIQLAVHKRERDCGSRCAGTHNRSGRGVRVARAVADASRRSVVCLSHHR